MTPFGARLRALRAARGVTLANRLAQDIGRLPPETVAAMHALLDRTRPPPKPRLRRAAGSQR